MTEVRSAPYPADTRARGWRFEIDQEQVRQSDTWALAGAEVRPWLYMLWITAWEQVPCGSLPNDDALIAARMEMKPAMFKKWRPVLLRGWWPADDGRLYHDTIVTRVIAMLGKRAKDAKRAADARSKREASQAPPPEPPPSHAIVTRDSQVNHGAVGEESEPSSAPSTQHPAPSNTSLLRSEVSARPSLAAEACRAMRLAGMTSVNPSDPRLTALLDAGITIEELAAAAADSVKAGKPFAYALAVAEGRRRDANNTRPLPSRADGLSATAAALIGAAPPQINRSEVIDV